MNSLKTMQRLLVLVVSILVLTQTVAADELIVTEKGNVGIGTDAPTGKLEVIGDIRAGNSDIYFTKTDHNHTGVGNTPGHAAIENAANYESLMILGRAGTSRGRYVRLWDYLQVNGGMDITGNVGIGAVNPTSKLDVNGWVTISNPDPYLRVNSDNKHLVLSGGSGWVNTGATMVLRGKADGYNPYGIEMYAGGAERIRVLSNGFVGIGDPNPLHQLSVAGDLGIKAGHTIRCPGRLHVFGEELLYILNKSGMVIGKEWGGTGNLSVQGLLSLGPQNAGAAEGGEILLTGVAPYKNWTVDVYRGEFRIRSADFVSVGGVSANFVLSSRGLEVPAGIKSTDILQISDSRFKTRVETLDSAIDKVSQLRGVSYDWIDQTRGKGRQIGVIAQEVETVFPEVVHTDEEGYKSVDYAKLVAPLIEAVKELKQENDNLASENKVLKQQNQNFEERLTKLEQMLTRN